MVVVTTKQGDGGTSGLFTGEREKKNHRIFECLGTLDELTAHLGLLRIFLKTNSPEVAFLQSDLYRLCTVLASHPESEDYPHSLVESWNLQGRVKDLESRQKELMATTPLPDRFIIPGEAGNLAGAQADVARTVCRRAEREVVAYREESGRKDLEPVMVYLNRASDYLFVLARVVEAAGS